MELFKDTKYYDAKKKMIKLECWRDENGAKQGPSKSYYSNRRMDISCNYLDNEYHGEYKEWHRNGQLRYHLFCHEGKKHGEYSKWDENGKPERHDYYFNGKKITEEVLERTGGDPVLIKLMYNFSIPRRRQDNGSKKRN